MKQKQFTLITCFLLVTFIFISSSSGFNFDEIGTKEEGPKISVKDVRNKITKEFFFEVMKSRFASLATPNNLYDDSLLNRGLRMDSLLAFDEKGNPVKKWMEEYPKNYLVIPDRYAFDMILVNSYNLQYKPSGYYVGGNEDYPTNYYYGGEVNDFDKTIDQLITYYVMSEQRELDEAERALDQAKSRLESWKNEKFRSQYREDWRDSFLAMYAFASDYNEFIKLQVDIWKALKEEDAKKRKKIEEEEKIATAKKEAKKKIEIEEKRKTEKIVEEEVKKEYQKKVAQLARKYAETGPPVDFLSAQFRTYAGASISGDMGAVVEFLDRLIGKRKWQKKDTMWVLYQTITDEMTGKKQEATYGFYDLRKKEGYVWLERVIIDGREYPRNQLFYFVQGL